MTLSDQEKRERRSPVVTVTVLVPPPRGLRHPSGLPVLAAMEPGDFWMRVSGATTEECRAASIALLVAPVPNAHLPALKIEN